MVDACKEAGVTFMAGHVMNFFHGVRHAKALIKAGEIGEVTQVHTKRNGFEDVQDEILMEEDSRKVRRASVPSHSRARLYTVHHG